MCSFNTIRINKNHVLIHTQLCPILGLFNSRTSPRVVSRESPSTLVSTCHTYQAEFQRQFSQDSFPLRFIYLSLAVLGLQLLCTGFFQLQQARATLPWDAQASHCGGLSCRGALRHSAFSSCGKWAQQSQLLGFWSTGSIIVLHGLSCSKVCGILPDKGSNLCLLHWQAVFFFFFLPLSRYGSPLPRFLTSGYIIQH